MTNELPEKERLREQLLEKIRILNRAVWKEHVNQQAIDLWLENFTGKSGDADSERLHALHMLSSFMFFGQREIRELLKVLYRDHVRYPLLQHIREAAQQATLEQLAQDYDASLKRSRFLGVGNPSDSGSFLLDDFRQVNQLSRKLFVNTHEIMSKGFDPDVERFVFIDDFCGSGDTGTRYSKELVEGIKSTRPQARVAYCVLFGFQDAIATIRDQTAFDSANAAIELDNSFKCFSTESRYFVGAPSPIAQKFARAMALKYGKRIYPKYPLGYKDGQLLLGFAHNTPNNSLPILWGDEDKGWNPIFPRYRKQYGWSISTTS